MGKSARGSLGFLLQFQEEEGVLLAIYEFRDAKRQAAGGVLADQPIGVELEEAKFAALGGTPQAIGGSGSIDDLARLIAGEEPSCAFDLMILLPLFESALLMDKDQSPLAFIAISARSRL